MVFLLLMSGGCWAAGVQIEAGGPIKAVCGVNAADRNDWDVEALVAPYVRGGSKLKKQDKKQADTQMPALEAVVVCRIVVCNMPSDLGKSLPTHGYFGHLHRRALY